MRARASFFLRRYHRECSGVSLVLRAATVLACFSSTVAGCSLVPVSGGVNAGLSSLQQAQQNVQYDPAGPVPGMTPEQIVHGFLLAATSSVDNYAIAREFLTPAQAREWDPASGVLIDEGKRVFSADGESAATLSLELVGQVDERGILGHVQQGQPTKTRFEFERVRGQWRISVSPAGIILDRTNFSEVWVEHSLFFVGAGGVLVPEARWFARQSSLPTRIVRELLLGPAKSMGDVLSSGFPAGSELVGQSVPVVDGVARVDVTGDLLSAGSQAVSFVSRQLEASLRSVAGVSRVELFAAGIPVQLPGVSAVGRQPGAPEDFAVVLRDGQLGVYRGGEFAVLPGGVGELAGVGVSSLSVSSDMRRAAATVGGGVVAARVDGVYVRDERDGLLAPSFDSFGYTWSVSVLQPLMARVADPDGVWRDVSIEFLEGYTPVAFRVSPDGARLAVLAGVGGQSFVLVAGIVRDAAGMPTGVLDVSVRAFAGVGVALDFDWVDQQRFVVLQSGEKGSFVTVAGVGVFPVERGVVAGAVRISGSGGGSRLRVITDVGDVYVSRGSGWQLEFSGVGVLAKRG